LSKIQNCKMLLLSLTLGTEVKDRCHSDDKYQLKVSCSRLCYALDVPSKKQKTKYIYMQDSSYN